MKTIKEFIQRLQDDPAFEKQAQAFDNGDDLLAFVKGEGYDFTLEQLASEFKQEAESPPDAGGMAPAPGDLSASTPPSPDDLEFSRQPDAFPQRETSSALPESGSDGFIREQPEEPPMKTIKEFIQRLQNDPAFEKQAQAFDNGDELMAFVKGEGYDFTLEQLASEFKQGAELPPDAGGMAPAPGDLSASTPPSPDDPEFSRKPDAFPQRETSSALPESGSNDFTREQPQEGLQNPPGPAEKSPIDLFRGGGGRHRGVSPQRLKSISEEDP
jgi:predicted ribosomally synthesized peptide with nif11-like leader